MATEQIPSEILFDGPVPGESLTSSPDSPAPYERPPEFTDYDKAVKYLFETMTSRGDEIVELAEQELPLEALAMQILFQGFRTGKWNPDLLVLLIEPVLYICLFICEQSGVDYVLGFDDGTQYADDDHEFKAQSHIQDLAKQVGQQTEATPVEEVLPPSLLAGGM